MVIFQNLSKNGEMLKNVGENIKNKFLHWSSFTPQDIKNIIFNPKFYQHFLPSLLIRYLIIFTNFTNKHNNGTILVHCRYTTTD